MKFTSLAIVIISTFIMSACVAQTNQIATPQTDATAMNEPSPSTADPNQISTTGTVRFQEMEGGFWGIVADDGGKYDPLKLDEKFQKEGLRVRFKAIPDPDIMSTHMWGKIVKLTQIEKIQ